MKKAYLYILLVLVAATSCRDSYDDYVQDRGETIGFTTPTLEVTLPPGGVINGFPLAFFVTSVSSSDRTFQLRVVDSETTLSADNYSFETTVTVLAGERKGTLLFNAENNSIAADDFQNVVIEFMPTESINSGKKALVSLKSTQ
ncbi:MAG TPA: hypothetical protein PKW08_03245 [Flavobacteriaceae bacterium]|mgnify:CR=1 FL=1|nr:hypothetical protein [Flavobacteriaceae bacterium]MCB9212907.1 hypothetical protein [Alteromonas sp.]HPF11421.1 hypothetical protein [Flavobacteriaceae bacterium]HQU20584.1 hypothetical protein [Flavobacteriaceae bacterium]HQU65093.1 hypothetical protein [Flavobacteriaceae bacterium]